MLAGALLPNDLLTHATDANLPNDLLTHAPVRSSAYLRMSSAWRASVVSAAASATTGSASPRTTLQTCLSEEIYHLVVATWNSVNRTVHVNVTEQDLDHALEYEISIQAIRLSDVDLTTNTILLGTILGTSLVLLFCGQMFAVPSIVIISIFGSFAASFLLFYYLISVWAIDAFSEHSTITQKEFIFACYYPLGLAVFVSLVVALLLCCLRKRMPRITGAIYGAAKGVLGAIATGELFAALFPSIAELPEYDTYFFVFVVVSTIVVAVISAYHPREVVIYIMVFLGAYGTTLGIDSLIALYTDESLENWAFLVIFGVACVLGAVVQCYFSGNDAEAHRKEVQEAAQRLTGADTGGPASRAQPLIDKAI